MMKLLTQKMLDSVCGDAVKSPRLRMNYNLHGDLNAPAQRLFNALAHGTKIPIHRHKTTDETYIVLRGKLRITIYDAEKHQLDSAEIAAGSENFGVHISAGSWHGVEVVSDEAVIFEVKDGPYSPFSPDDILN